MGNTLTALQPILFSAAQEVSAEPFGVVNSIFTDFDDKGVAKGDNVVVPLAPTRTPANFAPAAAASAGTDAVAANITVAITDSQYVSWHLTGEQIRSLENAGSDKEWVRQMVAQGMRALRNTCEANTALQIKYGASRATGNQTTTTEAFAGGFNANATGLADLIRVRQILREQGAPMADLQCVLNSTAYSNLLNLGIIQQAYAAGNDQERRQGKVARQFGFQIQESAGIVTHTKGTANGAGTTTNAGFAVGVTTVATAAVGTGTVLPGDVIKFANNTEQYVSTANIANIAVASNLTFNRPGLRTALAAANQTYTVANSYTPNLAFERSAVVGVFRPPVIPANPTISQQTISDESGLTYLLLDIAQYGMRTWELHLAWGSKVVQPEHVAMFWGA